MRNLLTNEDKKSVRREYCWRLLSLASATLLITAIIGIISLIPSYVLSRTRHGAVMDRAAAGGLDSTSKKIELAKATLTDIAAKEVHIANMLSSVTPTQVIDAIVAEKGSTIWLEGFAFRNKTETPVAAAAEGNGITPMSRPGLSFEGLSINGIARDRTSLTNFAKRLEGIAMVKSVDVPVSNFEKGRGIDFSIIVALKIPLK